MRLTMVRGLMAAALVAATLAGRVTRASAETFMPVDFSSQANLAGRRRFPVLRSAR